MTNKIDVQEFLSGFSIVEEALVAFAKKSSIEKDYKNIPFTSNLSMKKFENSANQAGIYSDFYQNCFN